MLCVLEAKTADLAYERAVEALCLFPNVKQAEPIANLITTAWQAYIEAVGSEWRTEPMVWARRWMVLLNEL